MLQLKRVIYPSALILSDIKKIFTFDGFFSNDDDEAAMYMLRTILLLSKSTPSAAIYRALILRARLVRCPGQPGSHPRARLGWDTPDAFMTLLFGWMNLQVQ